MNTKLHESQPVFEAGTPVERAAAAVILVHGRGGSAEDFLSLSRWLDTPNVAYLAPQAAGGTWYPRSFLSPMEQNQPGIDSGIATIEGIVTSLQSRGLPSERVMVVGFSQGACLTSEFAARHPRRYGGIAALIGGLIGPPGTPRDYPGSLDGTPVYLGSADPDPHVPWTRVEESARVFERMGASVRVERFAGAPHMISDEQMERVKEMLEGVIGASATR